MKTKEFSIADEPRMDHGTSGKSRTSYAICLGCEPAFRGAQIYQCAVRGKKIDVRRSRIFRGAAGAAAKKRAYFADVSSVCLDGWFGAVFVRAGNSGEQKKLTQRTGRAQRTQRNGRVKAGRLPKPASVKRVYAERGAADDLHFHAGRLRRRLPFLPHGTTGTDSQPDGGRDSAQAVALESKRSLRRQTNIVLMGPGESPLLNFEGGDAAGRIMLDPEAMEFHPST